MIQFNIRVTSRTRCKSAKGTAFFAYKTTPLQFCTGVVQKRTLDWYEKGFRPLQFCTGVVQMTISFGTNTGFRPLQFCTGVVQTDNKLEYAPVLDPCNFARV